LLNLVFTAQSPISCEYNQGCSENFVVLNILFC